MSQTGDPAKPHAVAPEAAVAQENAPPTAQTSVAPETAKSAPEDAAEPQADARTEDDSTMQTAARAFGRSLDDFPDRSAAETTLLECCRLGQLAVIPGGRPEQESDANRVRADLVRFLLLGGDDKAPVHENGVRLQGAWLKQPLDLSTTVAKHPLTLWDCVIEKVNARYADLKFLSLNGCRLVGGLDGDGLSCAGDITLTMGFESLGSVTFVGATIKGTLDCGGGNPAATAPNPNYQGGLFKNSTRGALSCAYATISGGLFLRWGFRAVGEVNVVGASIGRDLDCTKGSFLCPSGDALHCFGVYVAGGMFFRAITALEGCVDMAVARVGTLCDEHASWSKATSLVLDGFTYERLAGTETSANERIGWLDMQASDDLGDAFKPQPWEQLIGALRRLGHANDARTVAIAKQKRLRKAGKIPLGARNLHRLYGAFVGYGYRPARLLLITFVAWLLFAAAYWEAAEPGWTGGARLIRPADQQPSAACLLARAAARSGDPCPAPAVDYDSFDPLVYSADVLLPIVDFDYANRWTPILDDANGRPLFWGRALRYLRWLEIALGWLLGGALVAMLGNLVKKE
jgi:hypothetical protein